MWENMVPRFCLGSILALLTVGALLGCGRQEVHQFRAKVTELEHELQIARGQLAENDRVIADLRAKVEQSDVSEEDLTTALVKVKVERDKLKQELTALRKRIQ